jgi:hypothetical protein
MGVLFIILFYATLHVSAYKQAIFKCFLTNHKKGGTFIEYCAQQDAKPENKTSRFYNDKPLYQLSHYQLLKNRVPYTGFGYCSRKILFNLFLVLRISRFLCFARDPVMQILRKERFGNRVCFRLQVRGGRLSSGLKQIKFPDSCVSCMDKIQ